jgi:hypothetical protein
LNRTSRLHQKRESFCPVDLSNTDITYNNLLSILEKCHNTHTKRKKNWIGNLALEAETAVTYLPVLDCEYYSN